MLTQAEQLAAIGQAIGRELRWEELPRHAAHCLILTGGLRLRPCGSRTWCTLCGSDETQAHQQGAAQDSCGGQDPRLAELSAVERPDRQ